MRDPDAFFREVGQFEYVVFRQGMLRQRRFEVDEPVLEFGGYFATEVGDTAEGEVDLLAHQLAATTASEARSSSRACGRKRSPSGVSSTDRVVR
ncbi:hypothetical protein SAMN04489731_11714 [Amycolatopsis regifaucium]|nr:hypothetical protein [Amycolatopsis regifaucium]SFJ19976.1 hypothetical protein SAMN04489731_11714 [Amycolatopsis regifaucium]